MGEASSVEYRISTVVLSWLTNISPVQLLVTNPAYRCPVQKGMILQRYSYLVGPPLSTVIDEIRHTGTYSYRKENTVTHVGQLMGFESQNSLSLSNKMDAAHSLDDEMDM